MTHLASLPASSRCAPLRALPTSAATPIQKFGSDPSALGLSLGCNVFAAAVLGTCFHGARSRSRIATRGGAVRATATKLNSNGKTKGDANGKVTDGQTNGPVVALTEPITDSREAYEEFTFNDPKLWALLPPDMRSAHSLERDRYLCTALEIGLKALLNAADTKSPEQMTEVILQRLDEQMTEVKHALRVDQKLQGLQQETVHAKDSGTARGTVSEEAGYEALVTIASTFGDRVDRVEHTGSACESGTKRKMGDHVIHINQPGAGDLRLVVEQETGVKCTKKRLLEQMAMAMEDWEAQAAIGLIGRRSLRKSQATFEQHGPKRIIVAVDQPRDSEETDLDWFALEVAYRTLRSQVVASAMESHTVGMVDVAQVKACVKNVERELNAVRKVKLNADQVRTSLEAIVTTVTEVVDNVRKELAEMENALVEAASGEKEVKSKRAKKQAPSTET